MSHATHSDVGELVGTVEACRILGISRSTLNRWEQSGRIRRATTVAGRPRWNTVDLQPDSPTAVDDSQVDDAELVRLRAELGRLVDSGDEALAGAESLRLMERVMRRKLALRTLRGDSVAAGEIAELMRLDLGIQHREEFERVRDLTREH